MASACAPRGAPNRVGACQSNSNSCQPKKFRHSLDGQVHEVSATAGTTTIASIAALPAGPTTNEAPAPKVTRYSLGQQSEATGDVAALQPSATETVSAVPQDQLASGMPPKVIRTTLEQQSTFGASSALPTVTPSLATSFSAQQAAGTWSKFSRKSLDQLPQASTLAMPASAVAASAVHKTQGFAACPGSSYPAVPVATTAAACGTGAAGAGPSGVPRVVRVTLDGRTVPVSGPPAAPVPMGRSLPLAGPRPALGSSAWSAGGGGGRSTWAPAPPITSSTTVSGHVTDGRGTPPPSLPEALPAAAGMHPPPQDPPQGPPASAFGTFAGGARQLSLRPPLGSTGLPAASRTAPPLGSTAGQAAVPRPTVRDLPPSLIPRLSAGAGPRPASAVSNAELAAIWAHHGAEQEPKKYDGEVVDVTYTEYYL